MPQFKVIIAQSLIFFLYAYVFYWFVFVVEYDLNPSGSYWYLYIVNETQRIARDCVQLMYSGSFVNFLYNAFEQWVHEYIGTNFCPRFIHVDTITLNMRRNIGILMFHHIQTVILQNVFNLLQGKHYK